MIEDAVLATLAYYDGLNYPLSVFELNRYLVNPQRLRSQTESIDNISYEDVLGVVEKLVARGQIDQEYGFYFLKGRTGLSQLRIEREKISAQKWRKCLRRAYWLQLAPWVRGMFVSGSLALGTVNKESDFDVLVLVEPRRLYLSRLILSGIASLIGARRTRYETTAPDKFCFNHYITTDALGIKHESLYNAQTYSHLVPMAVSPALSGKFFAENLWINKYVYNFTPHQQTIRRSVRPNRLFFLISRTLEFIGSGSLGNALEKKVCEYQQKRISSNPSTHASGGRVVYTKTELEFHPHSFEKIILNRYNETTRRLGISDNTEPDSGLKA
ncbi:MAG: nucleotidyltransferase domain-containing protein [Candidatus Pacebacteria bacterium]|nr:nucleotidyltransferase domain-containing protein [Candidatus Paceibacterota bacterium]